VRIVLALGDEIRLEVPIQPVKDRPLFVSGHFKDEQNGLGHQPCARRARRLPSGEIWGATGATEAAENLVNMSRLQVAPLDSVVDVIGIDEHVWGWSIVVCVIGIPPIVREVDLLDVRVFVVGVVDEDTAAAASARPSTFEQADIRTTAALVIGRINLRRGKRLGHPASTPVPSIDLRSRG